MRTLNAEAWGAAMQSLPTTNPLYPFRESFASGLGEVAGHADDKSVEALRGHSPEIRLRPRTREYTQAEVDALVAFVTESTDAGDKALLQRTLSSQLS